MSQAAIGPFSPIEFDFIWESLAIGETPYPLRTRSHGTTVNERAHLRNQVLTGLARRGVVDGRGDVDPWLAERFELLTTGTTSVDAAHLVQRGAPMVGALAAAFDGRGVLAVQDASGIRLHDMPGDALASTIVSLMPPAPRGRERSVTLRSEYLTPGRAAAANGALGEEDRKVLTRILEQERIRGGQIGANARSEAGTKSRAAVLRWFDTDSGRYIAQSSEGADGAEWTTIAPVDAAQLRHRIGEMLVSAQRGSNDW